MKLLIKFSFCCLVFLLYACTNTSKKNTSVLENKVLPSLSSTSIVVLGTIQDAGSPQIGCTKECCLGLHKNPEHNRQVSSLGLIDGSTKKSYLFDATPDIGSQLKLLTRLNTSSSMEIPDGIFLTHAHIGHYTGLMYLGKEAMDANGVPVYSMPLMTSFLSKNGPWNLLISRKNIILQEIQNNKAIPLSDHLTVTPFLVPHRDEFSETVGYTIKGPQKSALFMPDIDKWDVWDTSIIEAIKKVDYAFLDATFYDAEELNSRDISQIPHPFVSESLKLFKAIPEEEKAKIIFMHFNHTNPIVNSKSKASQTVLEAGFKIARRGDIYEL